MLILRLMSLMILLKRVHQRGRRLLRRMIQLGVIGMEALYRSCREVRGWMDYELTEMQRRRVKI